MTPLAPPPFAHPLMLLGGRGRTHPQWEDWFRQVQSALMSAIEPSLSDLAPTAESASAVAGALAGAAWPMGPAVEIVIDPTTGGEAHVSPAIGG